MWYLSFYLIKTLLFLFRLEEQINDLTELHQNEMENIR
jgi:hypothetical protein